MTKTFLIILLFCFRFPAYSLDSLSLVQKVEELNKSVGVPRLELLRELSFLLRSDNNSKARLYGEEGLVLASELRDSTEYYNICTNLSIIHAIDGEFSVANKYQSLALAYHQRNSDWSEELKGLSNLGYICNAAGDYVAADSLFSISETICIERNDSVGFVDAKLGQGINYLDWTNYDEANNSFDLALDMAKGLKDTITISKLYNNLGIIARRQGDLKKAVDYYFQAALFHKPNDLSKAKIYNNIGIVYKTMGDFDKALDFYKKSLKIKEELGRKKAIAYTLHNLGTVYKQMQNYGQALEYFNRSLEIKRSLEGKNNGISQTISSIGGIHLDLGNYVEAEKHNKLHLKLSQEEDNKYEISRALNNLARVKARQQKFDEAIKLGQESLQLAQEINFAKIIASVSKILSTSYQAIGDEHKYLFYQNQYWEVSDSLVNKNTVLAVSKLEASYEESLAKQKSVAQEKQLLSAEQEQKSKARKNIGRGIMLFLCMIATLGFLYYLYQFKLRAHAKELKLNSEKNSNQIKFLEEKIALQEVESSLQTKVIRQTEEKILGLEKAIVQGKSPESKEVVLSDIHSFLNENLQSEESWKYFKHYFTSVHKDFFKTLNARFPALTTYDLNLCAFIKLNLHNKEIAQHLGISPLSVKKARQRLYKKMDLPSSEALSNYIIQL